VLELTRQRLRRGWTTKVEASRHCLVHPARLGAIENGRARPRDDSIELARIASALEWDGDPADLLQEADD